MKRFFDTRIKKKQRRIRLKNLYGVLVAIFFIVCFTHCNALKKGDKGSTYPQAAEKHYERAKAAKANLDNSEVEKHLRKTVSAFGNHVEARQDLTMLYLRSKRYEEALEQANFLYDRSLDSSINLQFVRVRLFWETDQLEACRLAAENLLSRNGLSSSITSATEKYLRDATFTLFDRQDRSPSLPADVLPNAINSQFKEYFPFITADSRQLVFTRRIDMQERIYLSTKDSIDHWRKAEVLFEDRQGVNQGALCISADGRTIIYTMCNLPGGFGSCDLYIRTLQGDKWSAPRNMGSKINTDAWESQPALSPDGRTLYFVSNRDSGEGGMDIWYSKKDAKGRWSEPVNMGPSINTPEDEMTPYMHFDNKTFYFSSAGYPGFGGLDLFMTRMEDGEYQNPINLGRSINSRQDESGLIVERNGTTAYWAIVDEKNGRSDIYQIELDPRVQAKRSTYVQFIIKDKETLAPVRAVIEILDLDTNDRYLLAQADDEGKLLVTMPKDKSYAVHIFHPDYIFYSAFFDVLSEEETSFPQIMEIKLSRVLEVVKDTTEREAVVLENVFFETGSALLKASSEFELNKLAGWLKKHEEVRIRLEGHTDNVGQYEDNLQLSKDRALAVKSYLVDQGIEAGRLEYEGYADTRPIADNETPQGRAKNRRTAFLVLNSEK